MTHTVSELLAPAGNLEKLKVAVLYGAHAVYLSGQKFGLRQASDNFTYEELKEGVDFAHQHGAKVYITLNSFLHDKDIEELPQFVEYLDELKIDAVIVSDLGVIETVKKHSNIEVHLSTQASCLNSSSAKIWKKMGVKRIVLGREVSVSEAAQIKKESGLEIEMFIHGSMCMAYSGNCVISNYTQGRDSNRGGCAHSCRFEYGLELPQKEVKAFFMSSKDLAGLEVLPEFINAQIDSLKVEGRMKGHHYAGTITKVYREALDSFSKQKDLTLEQLKQWSDELQKVTHRDYTLASLKTPAGADSIYNEREHDEQDYAVAGFVVEVVEDEFILLEVRSAFYKGETLELVPFKGSSVVFEASFISSVTNDDIDKTKPGMVVKLPYVKGASEWNLVRRRVLQ